MIISVILLSVLLAVSIYLNYMLVIKNFSLTEKIEEIINNVDESVQSANEEILELKEYLDDYAQHLEAIFKKDLYHADETIKSMLKHTNLTLENIDKFIGNFEFIVDSDEETEEEEEN